MQFQVPQFIDVEDKIIGPFTMRQFLYLAGGIGLGYMTQRFIPYVGLILGAGFVAFGAALAFYRPNKKPFADMIESAFNFFKNSRLYIWRHRDKKTEEIHLDLENFKSTKHHTEHLSSPTTTNKLSDLSWTMDVQSSVTEKQKPHIDSLVV